jgi:hypothetical protein
LFIFA